MRTTLYLCVILGMSAAPALTRQAGAQQPGTPQPATSPGEWSANKLIGASVYDDRGVRLGSVADLTMSADNRLADIVVKTGGVLGLGGKLVPIPFGQVRVSADMRVIVPGAAKVIPTFVANPGVANPGVATPGVAPANPVAATPVVAGPAPTPGAPAAPLNAADDDAKANGAVAGR